MQFRCTQPDGSHERPVHCGRAVHHFWPRTASPEGAIVRTAFVSTYPPRRCGIASFTSDLSQVTGDREIVALHSPDETTPYPREVHHRIRRDEPSDYSRTASALSACVDVVSVQHEYGIWGGPDGEAVLEFVRALDVPAVVNLHSIFGEPTPRQREILVELVQSARATVVMSQSAADLLAAAYGVEPLRVSVIPHGVPDLPIVRPETLKAGLGLAGHEVILSFGLLRPTRGCEDVLEALPAVIGEHPTACYVIVGATHPDTLGREGEAYRMALTDRVKKLRLTNHVRFVDRFVGRVELMRWLEAADVVVTPYSNIDQIASGTLAYAMGAARPIVSTPYPYAAELLAEGRGVLVPPSSPAAIASALNELLADEDLRAAVGRRAHEYSRRMVWSEVGPAYRQLFERVVADVRMPALARRALVNA